MHSGASVAQPCLACGAGRETRTPTPKRWYLKPMRLPIPPYPHVGRRYVTMFRKGQARLIAAFRFLRTFLISRAGGRRRPRSPLIRHPRRGTGRNSGTEAIWRGKRQAAPHPPPSPSRPHLARHIACRRAEKTGNIYAATLTLYIARPAAQLPDCRPPAPDQRLRGFRTLSRPLSGHPSRLRTAEAPGDHQKHTNWSQIMHESPQSACFTFLHCNACIGDILLCLFLF